MEDGANEVVTFLKEFVKLYPEYGDGKRPFVITGESYAGKYIPHITRKVRLNTSLNITSALIGNPFTAPIRQRISTHLVAKDVGIIDSQHMNQVAALRRRCEESISTSWMNGIDDCEQTMNYIDEVAGNILSYDARMTEIEYN